jgi:hypothetical protein
MSVLLNAHDVREQPGITNICYTSDAIKVSVPVGSLGSDAQPMLLRVA